MRSRGSARLWAKATCGKEALLPEALFGYFLGHQNCGAIIHTKKQTTRE